MKVIVLGAGVIGVTTAWFLSQSGHHVELIDQCDLPAEETSYANAGLLAPSDAFGWARPSAPWTYFQSLFHSDWGIRIVPKLDKDLLFWSLRFLRECCYKKFRKNSIIKFDLARYSLECLNDIVAKTKINFNHKKKGILYLYGTNTSLQHADKNFDMLRELGWDMPLLNKADLLKIEPFN
ncbi:FAD-dependent oxidoreductase [Candidatus Spongiihabitans sp.]|uniref:FAD-dependent oxidoreductase n=1 Tax=Candidatus Spongiihabitans sp. TaxID=3101308 RepID=UPI003C6EDD0C